MAIILNNNRSVLGNKIKVSVLQLAAGCPDGILRNGTYIYM